MIGSGRPCAVITGAGRGIGHAIALALAKAGYDLVLGWRADEQAAKLTATAVEELGTAALIVQGDVVDPLCCDELAEVATGSFGGLDAWVNNAGISTFAPLLETSSQDARRLMEVNYLGTFHGVLAAGRTMASAGTGGRIVNIASDLGVQAAPLLGAYSASKFAVVGLTQAAALEFAPYKVTVNALCPGTVETDMVLAEEAAEAEITGAALESVRARILAAVPAGRWCTGEDVASAVTYLCSEAASFLTGQAICVNGGSILH